MEASGSMAACESATFAAVIDLDRNTGEFTCTKIVSPTNAIIRSTEDPATISIDSDSASAIEATDKNGKHSAQNPNATHKVPYGQHALRGRKHLTPPPGVELLLPDVPSAVTLPDLLRLLAPVRGYEVANIREFATPPNKNRRHSETATDTGVKTVGVDASANENPHGCHHTISRNDECPTAVCGASTDSSPDGGYPVLLRLTGERAVSRIAHAFQNAPYSSLEPDRRIALYRVVARTAVPPPRFDPCPICLDTLTPTDGGKTDTVTMLCSHSFHGDCLAQCLELRCPVCRYVPVGVVGNQCHDCDAEHGLWMVRLHTCTCDYTLASPVVAPVYCCCCCYIFAFTSVVAGVIFSFLYFFLHVVFSHSPDFKNSSILSGTFSVPCSIVVRAALFQD
eukprot:m.23951 g.23951  ORF g.23951 m.23951 type:complete len:395 (-) comp12992_c0_seq2:1463-2647(-)